MSTLVQGSLSSQGLPPVAMHVPFEQLPLPQNWWFEYLQKVPFKGTGGTQPVAGLQKPSCVQGLPSSQLTGCPG